jgi:cytochrome c oxidase subunit 2
MVRRRKSLGLFAFACLGLAAAMWARTSAGGQGQVREFTVEGNQFAFSPARIEVQKDDLVKVTFTARDMAHSFTLDEYRIVKRASAGQTVVFEFRADRSGAFTFYCNLSQSDKCREMKGHLDVR